MSIANPKHPNKPEGEWLQEDSSESSKDKGNPPKRHKDKSQPQDPFELYTEEGNKETTEDPWGPFEDLTRMDSEEEEVSGAFNDFEPIQTNEEVNSTEEHDLIF